MSSPSYFCSTCGKEHDGLPTDWGFKLPDEVHAFGYIERYQRTRNNADVCTVDEQRHFIRGVLPVPLLEMDDAFNWGVWLEVDQATHDAYVAAFTGDTTEPTGCTGTLASSISAYPDTQGLRMDIQFNGADSRPSYTFAADVSHGLAHEQRHGISRKRHHDILDALGFFDE